MTKLFSNRFTSFGKSCFKASIVIALITNVACSDESVGYLESKRPSASTFMCLPDYSVAQMTDVFLNSFFSIDENEKSTSQPLMLWANSFAAYRARGLYEEFGSSEWINFEIDLKHLNKTFLEIARTRDSDSLSREKVLKVTYFSKHIDLSSTKLKNYRLPSKSVQKKMERFQAGDQLCESWHEEWDLRGEAKDRFNVLVSVDTPANDNPRQRLEVASCFVRSSFQEMGFDNFDILENQELLIIQPRSVVDFTELAKWLFWIRIDLDRRNFDLTSREKLNVEINNLLEKECS